MYCIFRLLHDCCWLMCLILGQLWFTTGPTNAAHAEIQLQWCMMPPKKQILLGTTKGTTNVGVQRQLGPLVLGGLKKTIKRKLLYNIP